MTETPPKPPRRDPRAERARRTRRDRDLADDASNDPPVAASERPRVDPRAARAARTDRESALKDTPPAQISARPRVNPRLRGGNRQDGNSSSTPAPAPAPKLVRAADDAEAVVVHLALDAGSPRRCDLELLGAVRDFCDETRTALVALACVTDKSGIRFDPSTLGVDRVMWLEHPDFALPCPVLKVAALAAATAALEARQIIFADQSEGGELGRRLAARLGERPATAVARFDSEKVTCVIDAGRRDLVRPLPRILLLRPDTFAPIGEVARRDTSTLPAPDFEHVSSASAKDLKDEGILPVDPSSIPLAEAELILAAGNGVSDWPTFHALAHVLEAAEGGSRVVCDNGALPRGRQVGASGSIVAPRCYIAMGISGASQHLDGIAACPRVVAVNSDPHAAMLKRADLAVVGDVQSLMPALLRKLEGDA